MCQRCSLPCPLRRQRQIHAPGSLPRQRGAWTGPRGAQFVRSSLVLLCRLSWPQWFVHSFVAGALVCSSRLLRFSAVSTLFCARFRPFPVGLTKARERASRHRGESEAERRSERSERRCERGANDEGATSEHAGFRQTYRKRAKTGAKECGNSRKARQTRRLLARCRLLLGR